MKLLIIANSISLLAMLSPMANVEAARMAKKQTVVAQGGLSLTTSNDQAKTFDLRSGYLPSGTYKYVVTIQNGTINDMTVLDGSRNVYADTAPGWGWSSMYNPNEIAFTLGQPAKGIVFSASTESQEVSLDYKLVSIK